MHCVHSGSLPRRRRIVFTFNNYLIFWRGWPEIRDLLAHMGLSGTSSATLQGDAVSLAVVQVLLNVLAVVGPLIYCLIYQQRTLTTEAATLAALSGFITRTAFWAVLLIGVVDMTISFLRVEGFLPDIVGDALAKDLGRSAYRGEYIHYPLMALAVLISAFTRSLGFTWLALMIVLAEFQIVLARFIFSYEQAFMGDLVRFWYAGPFFFLRALTR